jgi:hypothetical protein
MGEMVCDVRGFATNRSLHSTPDYTCVWLRSTNFMILFQHWCFFFIKPRIWACLQCSTLCSEEPINCIWILDALGSLKLIYFLSWLLQCVLSRLTPIATCLPFESLVHTSVGLVSKNITYIAGWYGLQYFINTRHKPIHQSTEFFGGEFLPFYHFINFWYKWKNSLRRKMQSKIFLKTENFITNSPFWKKICQKLSQLRMTWKGISDFFDFHNLNYCVVCAVWPKCECILYFHIFRIENF